MIIRYLAFLVPLSLMSFMTLAEKIKKDPEYQLSKAAYFLNSNPQKTTQLLNQISIADLEKDDDYIKYYHLSILAALRLHNLATVEKSFSSIFLNVERKAFHENRYSILYSLSVWLRMKSLYGASEKTLLCALKGANSESEQMRGYNALGILTRHEGKHKLAEQYFKKTLKIAKSIDNKKAVAITNNNLGVMSLESEDIKQSIAFFKRAYSAYQMSDYESGKMNSGINLLFSLVILGDKSTYDRIYNNVEELVQKYDSKTKNAYFEWVKAFAMVKFAKQSLTAEQLRELQASFLQIDEIGLQKLLKKYAAKPINVDVELIHGSVSETKSLAIETRPWLKKAIECNF